MKRIINDKYHSDTALRQFVDGLPQSFDCGGTVLYDKRNVIKSFDMEKSRWEKIVVKRYRKPYIWQRIAYTFFRKSKAERAFRNALKLEALGVSTPEALAYAERKSAGLFSQGFFVSTFNDDPPIKPRLVDQEMFDERLAAAFAEYVAFLHEKGVLHHDLNPTNVIYHEGPDGEYVFSVIDINRMDFAPEGQQLTILECLENLTRCTRRMDLFEFILRHYAEYRGLDVEKTMVEAMSIKRRYDKRRKRRRTFIKKFKRKKTPTANPPVAKR